MMSNFNKRDLRQAKYISRGKKARMYGRVLIPITMLVLGQAMWSDPDLGPQLAEGLDEIRPMLATYAQDTPLDGTFGPVPEGSDTKGVVSIDEAKASISDAISASLSLPESRTAVNRP